MRNVLKAFLLSLAMVMLCIPAFADTPGDPADPQTPPVPAPAPATPAPAPKPAPAGPIQIKVNDNVNFRFGLLLQPQLDLQENAAGQTGENLMLRRVRFIVSGQVAKNAYFFFQTENSRLG